MWLWPLKFVKMFIFKRLIGKKSCTKELCPVCSCKYGLTQLLFWCLFLWGSKGMGKWWCFNMKVFILNQEYIINSDELQISLIQWSLQILKPVHSQFNIRSESVRPKFVSLADSCNKAVPWKLNLLLVHCDYAPL